MIYIIIGPTGCGKTDAANEIACHFHCPIINADAFQIYKDMNIGTNKMNENDPMFSSYYMLNVVSPEETYSVKEYQKETRQVLNKLLLSNKDIVIVGGTGLYIKALLYDYVFNDENDLIDQDLLDMNNEDLHALLTKLDPEESLKIHVNNRKRLLRAIMLIRNNSLSKTELLSKQEHKMIYDSNNVSILYIKPNREELYDLINKRVIKMFELGLLDEVKNLLEKYKLSLTATQGIGYKEVIQYLNKEISYEECLELIQKRTRNYAKRQLTFFNNQFENYKIYSSKDELVNSIIKK